MAEEGEGLLHVESVAGDLVESGAACFEQAAVFIGRGVAGAVGDAVTHEHDEVAFQPEVVLPAGEAEAAEAVRAVLLIEFHKVVKSAEIGFVSAMLPEECVESGVELLVRFGTLRL
jgi:hypothetical protein